MRVKIVSEGQDEIKLIRAFPILFSVYQIHTKGIKVDM